MQTRDELMNELIARRDAFYEQLRQMQDHLAESPRSPSFGTRDGDQPTTAQSIDWVRTRIADLDRQIADLRDRTPENPG